MVILIARWVLNDQTIHSARNRSAPSILFWTPYFISICATSIYVVFFLVRRWIYISRHKFFWSYGASAGL